MEEELALIKPLLDRVYQEIVSCEEDTEMPPRLWNMKSAKDIYPQELNDVFIPARDEMEFIAKLEKYAAPTRSFLRDLLVEYCLTNLLNDSLNPEDLEESLLPAYWFISDDDFTQDFWIRDYLKIEFQRGTIIPEASYYPELEAVESASQEKVKYWVLDPFEENGSLEDIYPSGGDTFFPARTKEGALLRMDIALGGKLIKEGIRRGREQHSGEWGYKEFIASLHDTRENWVILFSFDQIRIVS